MVVEGGITILFNEFLRRAGSDGNGWLLSDPAAVATLMKSARLLLAQRVALYREPSDLVRPESIEPDLRKLDSTSRSETFTGGALVERFPRFGLRAPQRVRLVGLTDLPLSTSGIADIK